MAKARTTSIRFTSRASVKVRDSFYTVECCEERIVPEDVDEAELAEERAALWETVNTECDNQIQEIIKSFK